MHNTIRVTKRDGSLAPYDGAEVAASIADAARGLDDETARALQLQSDVEITLFDGITTEQLDEAVVQVTLGNVKDDPVYDQIAARLLIKQLYKQVFGDTSDLFGDGSPDTIRLLHLDHFPGYVERGVRDGYLDTRMGELFDLETLARALTPSRDDLLRFIGVQTMRNRYLLTDGQRRVIEVPQFFWMRVAMGLSLGEQDPTAVALELYEAMSRLEYLAAGSTLVGAGTPAAQLSNCFVMQMEDDIEHIAKSIRDVMWITKGTGGIGLSVTKLRSEGSPIRSNNTTSTGPIPFMHTVDSTLRAISRGGKKFGALCFYMENWHADFAQFLDLRQNSGDPYRRTRTADTAVWISDEFMQRVARDDDWYLFDPLETSDLVEFTGRAFSERYAQYVEMAEAGELRMHRKLKAREQWKAILVALQSTSHPWITFKDTINTRALNDNTGTIHLSNLCTEICLPQDRDNTAVCNLASVNLSRHLDGVGVEARFEWDRLARTVRTAVRQLDNLVDITASAVPEAEHANLANRAVGLGLMGFTDICERLRIAYDSPAAWELIDEIVEFISWHAIDASCDLARERGAYPNFAGSGWSKGLVPFDTLERLAAERGEAVEVDRSSRLDWNLLRRRVAGGIRNATLMAVAPTASIGLVAGTTPGLDPQFSHIFSRATSSGKFLEVNRNLVHDLKAADIWEGVRDELLRHQGDLAKVEGIPSWMTEVYKTSFQLDPTAYLHVAARAQKWIDQAISRNIYLADRNMQTMVDLYQLAWRMGVKTTYYLHMLPRHTAEQSTVKVNKAAATNKRGFGARRPTTPSPAPAEARGVVGTQAANLQVIGGITIDVDPQEALQCDSCQ